jgi:hypothetical protein
MRLSTVIISVCGVINCTMVVWSLSRVARIVPLLGAVVCAFILGMKVGEDSDEEEEDDTEEVAASE